MYCDIVTPKSDEVIISNHQLIILNKMMITFLGKDKDRLFGDM